MSSLSTDVVFGKFLEPLPATDEYLTINFSPTSTSRKERWRNNGISADFLGDYFGSFFPISEDSQAIIDKREEIKSTVSFIANELLENAMKYSDQISRLPVSISLHLYETELVFVAANHAHISTVDGYQKFIHELINSDIDELYTKQMEKAATGESGSSMGLLTMINDYNASLGWKFRSLLDKPNIFQVIIMVSLAV
ncbi:hypothetical protein Syn7502_00354 [Synechococcus sp. PCC 7502]|uniref:slr1658 superfamily regulator n=1 Tax=Synechococcus sp. PCC 7502 TaxID=1173263 RepID=UPI00029FC0E7|nr:hypothetical protein [Synechococcus sp. PCC 7502]AFY72518.1 hypothetical protein Syn7502_00354 [Synechococcus sp. PCC 7502]